LSRFFIRCRSWQPTNSIEASETETKTEISVNGKILIPLTKTETETKKIRKNGNETEMGKFETEADKSGYIRFVSVIFPF